MLLVLRSVWGSTGMPLAPKFYWISTELEKGLRLRLRLRLRVRVRLQVTR